ncbi:hypothetical protein [Helicobacter sp. MIT 14-3879]|nr:hypothetical protein [Helicobacter sp. MIT 14-3879]
MKKLNKEVSKSLYSQSSKSSIMPHNYFISSYQKQQRKSSKAKVARND